MTRRMATLAEREAWREKEGEGREGLEGVGGWRRKDGVGFVLLEEKGEGKGEGEGGGVVVF